MSSVEREMENLINEALALRQGNGEAGATKVVNAEPERKGSSGADVSNEASGAAQGRPTSSAKPKAAPKGAASGKPAWALTQEKAAEIEEEEEEELLSFVDSLDYDNYIETIDDPEVKVRRSCFLLARR